MQFRVGCELQYVVATPATFLFQVCAIESAFQKVVQETLQTEPRLSVEDTFLPALGNRLVRVTTPPGPFTLRYEAEVDSSPLLADPKDAVEIPIGELPLETLPGLETGRHARCVSAAPAVAPRTTAARPSPVTGHNGRGTTEQWREAGGQVERLSSRTHPVRLHAWLTISPASCAPGPCRVRSREWSLTTLREKVVKIGAKAVAQGRLGAMPVT